MPKDEISNTRGASALDQNIVRQFLAGYGVVTGVAPSDGTSGMDVDVASGTAWHNGGRVSVAAQTVTLSNGDSNPRKDLVYIDGTGTAQVIEGTPAGRTQDQAGDTGFDLYQPAPPDMVGTDGVLVAEVFVAAEATSLDSGDIRDRRVTSDAAFDALTAYSTTVQNALTVQSGATVNVGTNPLNDFDSAIYPDDAGSKTLADMGVTSSPAAGTVEAYSLDIDATALLEIYAEADGAGGIQNAALNALTALAMNGNAINGVGSINPDATPLNVGGGIDATGDGSIGGSLSVGTTATVGGTATVDGADIEVDHFSADDGGVIKSGDAANLYTTELADGETIYATRASHLKSDGTAAPTGIDLGIVTLANDGTGTWQTTILSGDGATVFDDDTTGASYTYAPGDGSTTTVAIVADNGNFAGASGGSGSDTDIKNDVNGRVA